MGSRGRRKYGKSRRQYHKQFRENLYEALLGDQTQMAEGHGHEDGPGQGRESSEYVDIANDGGVRIEKKVFETKFRIPSASVPVRGTARLPRTEADSEAMWIGGSRAWNAIVD